MKLLHYTTLGILALALALGETAPGSETTVAASDGMTILCPERLNIGITNPPGGWSSSPIYALFSESSVQPSLKMIDCTYEKRYSIMREFPSGMICQANGRQINCKTVKPPIKIKNK